MSAPASRPGANITATLAVPSVVRVVNSPTSAAHPILEWHWTGEERGRSDLVGCLERFSRLGDSSPEAVESFAKTWGPLQICEKHGKPSMHDWVPGITGVCRPPTAPTSMPRLVRPELRTAPDRYEEIMRYAEGGPAAAPDYMARRQATAFGYRPKLSWSEEPPDIEVPPPENSDPSAVADWVQQVQAQEVP